MAAGESVLIKAHRLIDGRAGDPLTDLALEIVDGRIKRVYRQAETLPDVARTFDLGGCTIVPGLVDAHMHLFGVPSDQVDRLASEREPYRALTGAYQATRMLEAGITAARCLGSSVGPDIRRAIDEGLVRGPRLKVAGEFICSTFGTWDFLGLPLAWMKSLDIIADGADAVRAAVRRRVRSGSDFIKLGLSRGQVHDRYHAWGDDPLQQTAGYSLEEVVAAVDEAHRNRLKVSAHCIGEQAVRLAIDGGVDIVEHGYGITEETRAILVERQTPVVSTITQLEHHRLAFDAFRYPEWQRDLFKRHMDRMRFDFERSVRAGVRYALGSDLIGPPTHPQWAAATEFALAVEWGMSPMQALTAGTRVGAEVLGMQDQIGTIEPGKLADIVAVDADPLTDMTSLQHPKFVMQGGIVIADAVSS